MCGIGSDWIKAAAESADGTKSDERAKERALIIFVKNPILGKVKTRLAKTMGDDAAFAAYLQMVAHVREVAAQVDCHRAVFYSDFVVETDAWERALFSKHVQCSGELGGRMATATEEMLQQGFKKVLLVGSDFLDLQVQHLEQGFRALEFHDFVLGPANDGGYYLIGMKDRDPLVFNEREWSTDTVFATTLADMRRQGKSVFVLPEIADIDYEEDWIAALQRKSVREK